MNRLARALTIGSAAMPSVHGWTASASSNKDLVSNLQRDQRLSARVADALLQTDRADFVAPELLSHAYEDRPLPIGFDVTISAPHMHAAMLQILEPKLVEGARCLDVGVGSGFLVAAAATLVGASGRVVGVDRVPQLVGLATQNLRAHRGGELLSSGRVSVLSADGWEGWAEGGPYDAIHVGAAAARMPTALAAQLAPGGRMVVPIGPEGGAQELLQVDKDEGGAVTTRALMGVRFVPLVPGAVGQPATATSPASGDGREL